MLIGKVGANCQTALYQITSLQYSPVCNWKGGYKFSIPSYINTLARLYSNVLVLFNWKGGCKLSKRSYINTLAWVYTALRVLHDWEVMSEQSKPSYIKILAFIFSPV